MVTVTAEWTSSCSISTGTIYSFDYTGSEQTFTVPCDGYYQVELWGAQGAYGFSEALGGYGGHVTGIYSAVSDTAIYIYVGGTGSGIMGGYNGGGTSSSGNHPGYGGGGATDVRIGGNALSNRVVVAAGGGGASGNSANSGSGSGQQPGYSGGDAGADGYSIYSENIRVGGPGRAGTLLSGGDGGEAGIGSAMSHSDNDVFALRTGGTGGGGGGGYYGGGGGGGGSSFNISRASNGGTGTAGLLGQGGTGGVGSTVGLDSGVPGGGGGGGSSYNGVLTDATIDISSLTGNGYAVITWLGTSI